MIKTQSCVSSSAAETVDDDDDDVLSLIILLSAVTTASTLDCGHTLNSFLSNNEQIHDVLI